MGTEEIERLPPFISSYVVRHAANIEATIARLDADLVRKHDSFVFKVTPEVLCNLGGAGDSAIAYRKDILARTLRKTVQLLCYSPHKAEYEIFSISIDQLDRTVDNPSIADLRQRDLYSIVSTGQSYGMLQVTPGHHFVSPSGHHCRRFLRAADMMHSLDSLDCASYWLLADLKPCRGVIVDNWNIAPLALRAMSEFPEVPIAFDFLPGHARSFESGTYRVIERMLTNVLPGERVLCLTSVCSTGTNIDYLRRTFARFGREDAFHPLALFAFSDAPADITALCRLDTPSDSYASADVCELCKQGSHAVTVDPHLFYVRTPQEHEVALRKEHLETSSFTREYAKTRGVLFVHKDDPNDGRHHAMYVDVRGLLGTKQFRRRLQNCLTALSVKPEVVVVPNHEAGRALAHLASQHIGVPTIVHDDLRPENGLTKSDIALLSRARSLLILDDVLITGSRFERFNCALRENTANFGTFANVDYLVGVGRPASAADWRRNEVKLTTNHDWTSTLSSVERIYLPYWKSEECPWCHEYEMLSRISRRLAAPPAWLTARLTDLTQKQLGLDTDPLLRLPKVPPRRLGNGSRVGPHKLSATFTLFSLANGLQCLRNDPKPERRLIADAIVSNVFGAKNLANYSEGLIRALLLRLVQPHEWGHSNRTSATKLLLPHLHDPAQSSILGEMVLARHRGSLRELRPSDLGRTRSRALRTMQDLLIQMP